jgi:hypothetical protein
MLVALMVSETDDFEGAPLPCFLKTWLAPQKLAAFSAPTVVI